MSETSIMNVYVTRESGKYGDTTCSYKTGGGTAVHGVNYLTGAGDLMWKDGDMTAKFFPVTIIDDGEWTPENLWFTASLSNITNSWLGYNPLAAYFELTETTIEIINKNPKQPGTMSFVSGAYSVNENAGTVTLYITRSGGWDGEASVRCRTSNGTAIAGVSADYNFKDETLTWAHHEAGVKPFTVTIHDNAQWVAVDKYFTCSLSTGVGAIIGTLSRSIVTIIDDEVFSPGTMSFVSGAYSVNENAGTVTLYVTRSGGTDTFASVVAYTLNGTAIAGTHYSYTMTGLSWENGEHVAKPFVVPITDDAYWNEDRYFTASLTTANTAIIGTLSRSIVTIINDEPYLPGTISFVLPTDSIEETTSPLTVNVQRTGGSSGTASVRYQTIDGTAVDGVNYTAVEGILNWAANDSANKSFTVPIIDANIIPIVGFTASLYRITSSLLGTVSKSFISILPVGGEPSVISFVTGAYTAYENVGTITLQVSRTGGTYGAVSVDFQTVDGTATQPADYTLHTETLSWADGENDIKNVIVTVTGEDGVIDGDKAFTGFLDNISGGLLDIDTTTVTIVDTTTIVQFVDNLFTRENGYPDVTMYLERTGYATGAVSVGLQSFAAPAFYNTPPANGLETAVSFIFKYVDEFNVNHDTYNISWADGETGAKPFTLYYTDNIDSDMSAMGTSSIISSTNCVIGPVSKANLYIHAEDAMTDFLTNVVHFQTPTYEFAVNQLGDSAATVDAYVFYNLCPPTYLSNISAPTTVSFTTVDGTAIAGVDYETLSGDITFPNPSVNYAEVPSTIGPITIHPTCIGKYFYIQLSNPRPTGETSIAYSSRIKMTGYGGSLVSLPNSQSEFAFNDSVVLTLSRGGLDTSYGLDVDVYISEINNSSNIPPSIFEFTDPINYGISGIAPNRTWPYRVSWFAGDTAPKTLTFGDPAETTDGKTGYYRARLEKVSLTDNVLFDPHPYTQVLYLANNSLYYSGSVVGAIDTPITVSLSYTGITYVRGKNLTTMTSMTIIWGSLEKVDITNAPICNTIFLYNNLLPSFDISPFPLAASVVLNDNLLTQAAVDDILVKLAAGSVYGGYVDLSNYYGPGNAIPSATGLSAKATLESRGWTVTVQT